MAAKAVMQLLLVLLLHILNPTPFHLTPMAVVDAQVITRGSSEWGILCKINASDFQPESISQQNALLSLFPSLHSFDNWQKPPQKPCCFPQTWESGFTVQTRRIGVRIRNDRCLYRVQRDPRNASNIQTLMIIGPRVLSNSFCDDWRGPSLTNCPIDSIECMHLPFLGEPRCISQENGFYFIPGADGTKELWITDSRIPSGGTRRHIYTFSRKFEVCRLESYQILTGQYVNSKQNCRMMFLMDQLFTPLPGTFHTNMKYGIAEGIFDC